MKERKFILVEDDGMGGLNYVFSTNAPKSVLKDLEKRTQNEKDDEYLIWTNEVQKYGDYFITPIDEFTNVSAYGTADDLIEEEYGKIKEVYYCYAE